MSILIFHFFKNLLTHLTVFSQQSIYSSLTDIVSHTCSVFFSSKFDYLSQTASKLGPSDRDLQHFKPMTYFLYLPVTKASCFGLNYSQIPQGWIFAVTTLLVPIYFNCQSTIIQMFHEVFRDIYRKLLQMTGWLMINHTTLTQAQRLSALSLI